jgi:hypothetical protein
VSDLEDQIDKKIVTDLENAISASLGLDDESEAIFDDPDFTAPAKAAERLSNEVTFNRWGQYSNLPPIPGEDRSQSWTRATTLKDILTDKRNLELWGNRQVIRGIAMQPHLIAPVQAEIAAGEIDFDEKKIKDWLNKIADDAKAVAGSFEGADKGTAFHTSAELYDAGNPFKIDDLMGSLDSNQAAMLAAYARSLNEHKIKPVGHLMERVICVPEMKIAGRLDRVYEDQDGLLKIGDLKSQKWEPGAFDGISLCVQLAIYANAKWMLNEETWEWEPFPTNIDKTTGIIAWVPAVKPGIAEIYDLDLEWGWKLAKASFKIRNDWRKDKSRVNRRRRPAVPLHDLG